MRIFTLGKNRIPLFFFALFLFSGTFSSFGQCPTVDAEDATQYFCDSQEAEISSLTVTTGTNVVWYSSQTSTTPLPETNFLVNGKIYYAGLADNSCVNNRAAVTVQIASEPEILGIKASTPPPSAQRKESLAVIGVCVADVNNPGLTIDDLRTSAENENNVRWYYNRTSTEPIPSGTELQNNTDYFAAVYSPDGNCETNRRKTTVKFFSEAAPTGPASQEFCAINNPTLGDIEASGENRYFSTASSKVELSPNTPLVNGRTYYISAVGENCESIDRLAVTVTVIEPADLGTPEPGVVCELDVSETFPSIDAIKNYYLSLLDEGTPTNGTFSPTPDEIATAYQNDADGLGDFTTTYTVGCDQVDLTVSIIPAEQADAGDDVTEEFNITDDPQNLYTYIANGLTSGYFVGYPDGIFDPAEEGAGTYTITYTVDETSGCISGSDSAIFSITVTECDANAGADINENLCSAQVEQMAANPEAALAYFNGLFANDVDQDGTFNPGLDVIYGQWQVNPIGTFTTTYTVGQGDCTDSATIQITVTEGDANAGSPNMGIVCAADVQSTFPSIDEIRKYYLNLLDPGVSRTGTLSPSAYEIAEMYQNDADGLGDFVTTYTVGEEGGCQASVDLTVRIVETVDAGENSNVTVNENDAPINLFDYLGGSPDEGGTWSPGDGIFDPATDEPGTFTYSIGSSSCADSATVTVTVTSEPTPCDIAGTPGYAVVCLSDVQTTFPSVDEIRKYYLNLLDEGVDRTGTLSPSAYEIAEMYQNDADGLGEFTTTYTVTVGDCTDSVELTVLITEEANAGEDASITVNENDAPVNLFTKLGPNAQQGGTWSSGNGMFDPATDEAGTYTYTVGSGDCTDSATVTVTVTSEPTDPCEGVVNAGTDSSATVCETDVDATFPSIDEIRKYYLNLLDSGIARTGTLSPTADEIATMYQNDADGLGDFTTTYTLVDGECSDSVKLTVTIVAAEQASTGDIADFSVCTAEGTINLFDYLTDDNTPGGTFSTESGDLSNGNLDVSATGTYTITYTVDESDTANCVTGTASTQFTVTVTANSANAGADKSIVVCNSEVENLSNAGVRNLYLGLLETGVPTNGTFNPTIQQIIDQYNINSRFGDFTTTYTVGTGNCTDSAVLTVTVLENPNAGQDATVNLEEGATETVDLFDALGGTPDTGGVWTDADGVTVDATFDPASDEEGVYTYTVTSDNGCKDSATVTVIIGDENPDCTTPPAAPVVADFDDCVVTGATVADLDITVEDGNTFTVYTDEALETPASDTDVLVEGMYYVTQTTAAGCVSDAAVITVTLSDTNAPTLNQGGNVFCEFDDATLADLEANIDADGDVTWYTTEDGSETYSSSEVLQDGTTYYAAVTDGTCESSERLAVTVTLDSCPIVIPEAFSPNGDGINERFEIEYLADEYPNFKLEIYNRWGEPVYIGGASTPTWDGTSTEGSFGSGVLPAGVYFYILYYNDGQTAPTQGRLYLSR